MKRLGILFFCLLFTLFALSCEGERTPVCWESAIYFCSGDNYAVTIRANSEGVLDKNGKVKGEVVDHTVEIIALTLDAEKKPAVVVFDDGTTARDKDRVALTKTPEVITIKTDIEEAVILSCVMTDESVFEYFDGVKDGLIRGYYVTGYGNLYYYCGYYIEEKLLYGVMFDEKFCFSASIGTI